MIANFSDMGRRMFLFSGMVTVLIFGIAAGVIYTQVRDFEEKFSWREQQILASFNAANISSTAAALDQAIVDWPDFKVESASDAGPYLNPRIARAWNVSDDMRHRFDAWQSPWPEITKETSTAILSFNWEHPGDEAVLFAIPASYEAGKVSYADLDDSWLDQIQTFDHWHLDSDGPLAWMDEEKYGMRGWAMNLDSLHDYFNVTLIKQFYRHRAAGTLGQFGPKVEKFAQLLASTENIMMLFTAEVAIENVTKLLGSAGTKKETMETPRQIQSATALNIRSLLHPSAIKRPGVKELLLRKHPLVCIGLHEGLRSIEFARTYVAHPEDFMRNEIEPIFEEQKKFCRFSRLRHYWGKLPVQPGSPAANVMNVKLPNFLQPLADFVLEGLLNRYLWIYLADPLTNLVPAEI